MNNSKIIYHVPPAVRALALAFILPLAASLAIAEEARYETTTALAGSGCSIQIADYETGEVVTYTPKEANPPSVSKNGLSFPAGYDAFGHTTKVRGPATISFSGWWQDVNHQTYTANALLTVKITPVSFPPNQTLIIPPGTNQFSVSLEMSTNLINWVAATNGVYGMTNSALFFRTHFVNLRP